MSVSTEIQANKSDFSIAYRHHFLPEIDTLIDLGFPKAASHTTLVEEITVSAQHMMRLHKAIISHP